jgi:hypothetical protein
MAFTASAQQYLYPGTSSSRPPVYGSGYGGNYIPGSMTEVFIDFSYGAFLPIGSYAQSGSPELDFNYGLSGGLDLSVYLSRTLGFNFTIAGASIYSEPMGSEYMDFWHLMLGFGISAKFHLSPYTIFFLDGGLAAVGANFEIPFQGVEYKSSSIFDTSFGFYVDAGLRVFVSPVVYLHLKARYLGMAETSATIINNGASETVDVELGGLYLTTGFGVMF